jgi:hypothetical protein
VRATPVRRCEHAQTTRKDEAEPSARAIERRWRDGGGFLRRAERSGGGADKRLPVYCSCLNRPCSSLSISRFQTET